MWRSNVSKGNDPIALPLTRDAVMQMPEVLYLQRSSSDTISTVSDAFRGINYKASGERGCLIDLNAQDFATLQEAA